jgi:hypothetical protein
MWRILSAFVVTAIAWVATTAAAQELRRPYGPFDAIAEGTARSESQRRSIIASQLDTVDQLRLSQVAGPRTLFRDPNVTAVYPYGRRGIFGLRPRGYIVVRRPPIPRSQRSYAPESPQYEPRYDGYDYSASPTVRQPIGHEQLQTGPDRWEYRPLYADSDRDLDERDGQVERNLRPPADDGYAERTGYATPRRQPRSAPPVNSPEELPEPPEAVNGGAITQNDRTSPRRGQARDIARDELDDRPQRANVAGSIANGRNNRPPPPPRPDPLDQPKNSPPQKQPAEDNELRGPLLKDPASGVHEF